MTTHFFTVSSLDGFISTAVHSLDWLLKQVIDPEGPMTYQGFEKKIGALAMGASTYEWVMRHEEGRWGYEQPTWVLTHRDLEVPDDADVRLTRADLSAVHAEMAAVAGDKNIWAVGGGDLAGQFADAGLLDKVWVQYAPVTLGTGAPLLPRATSNSSKSRVTRASFAGATECCALECREPESPRALPRLG